MGYEIVRHNSKAVRLDSLAQGDFFRDSDGDIGVVYGEERGGEVPTVLFTEGEEESCYPMSRPGMTQVTYLPNVTITIGE